jgi:hypothetical protein
MSAKSCLSAASSFGRAGWAANFGKPKAGLVGAPSFGYFFASQPLRSGGLGKQDQLRWPRGEK